jgi:hypothetical protein
MSRYGHVRESHLRVLTYPYNRELIFPTSPVGARISLLQHGQLRLKLLFWKRRFYNGDEVVTCQTLLSI